MAPQPSAIHMNMDGVEFEFPTGVLSIVSSGTNLYFHSVASRQEAWIPISELNNQSNFQNTTNASRFVHLFGSV
ncbi:hypothetical protein C0J52_02779 [Blattella germanica]|nr:hypothetical protein C0J52_02779 [Blattella germanica]